MIYQMGETLVHIYRAERGKWSKPKKASETAKGFALCQCPEHKARKRKFPFKEMYLQIWKLTKREMKEALDVSDYASLTKEPRIICSDCAHTNHRRLRDES